MILDGMSAAELNDAIRGLVLSGRAGSEEYRQLVDAWVVAMRAEQELAA
ncbi:hypothetical protein AB0953_16340 [Streptomyces sp. NPDC046866]